MKVPFSGLFSRFTDHSASEVAKAARERIKQRSQPPMGDQTVTEDENWDFTSKTSRRPQGRPVDRESLSRPAGLTRSSVSNILVKDDESFEPKGLRRIAPSIRSLVLGVSMAVAGYVGGTYVEQEKYATQADELQNKIVQLEGNVKKLSKRVEVPDDSRIVPLKTISGTLEYVEILKSRITELESERATPNAAKTAASPQRSSPESAQLLSKVTEVLKQVQGRLPTDTTLSYAKIGDDIRVTYSDIYGYSRYFTANRADNQDKLAPKWLVTWVNAHYVASLDVYAAKQGIVRH